MVEEIRTVALNTLPLSKAKAGKLDSLLNNCTNGIEYLLAAISWQRLFGVKLTRYY